MKTILLILCVFSCKKSFGQDGVIVKKYPDYSKHYCKRPCGGPSMVCRYEFTIEFMMTNSPNCQNCLFGNETHCNNLECIPVDGGNRLINTFNLQFPGPAIEVCQYDSIVVKLHNHLLDLTTSIHWHGMKQRHTQYMDGVPYVTQCPIQPNTYFVYDFVATEKGSHMYHVHTGVQRINGGYGLLIVRAENEPHKMLYDYDLSEHLMAVDDWFFDVPLIVLYRILKNRVFDFNQISNININGRAPSSNNTVPPSVFIVNQFKRYRMRIIHGGATVCPIEVSIAQHKMTIIASDGKDIQPILADSFFMISGERYDIVVHANQPIGSYVIKFEGSIICNKTSYAILRYAQAPIVKLNLSNAQTLPNNALRVNCINALYPNCTTFAKIKSETQIPSYLTRVPDFKYTITFDVLEFAKKNERGIGDDGLTNPYLNKIAYEATSTPLLQNDRGHKFCNKEDMRYCNPADAICECTHKVDIPYGAVVEVILCDLGVLANLIHPMHLHGYDFYVVYFNKFGASLNITEIERLDRMGLMPRNFNYPAIKDNVPVPDGGCAIIRWLADNRGYWLFHCHVESHTEEGMQMVFNTGGYSPMIPNNFPVCGNYDGENDIYYI